MSTTSKIEKAKPVIIPYATLANAESDLTAEIREAYGEGGLGIIIVSGVPSVNERRAALLPLSRALASLPAAQLSSLEHAASHYSKGWSHGREKMSENRFDTGKGSFYANPVVEDSSGGDKALRESHPTFATPNIWPGEDVLPGLRGAFTAYAGLVVAVAKELAGHLDRFVAKERPAAGHGFITGSLEDRACTGRLLYYFPRKTQKDIDDGDDGWCGYHNDHGSLTGLSRSMYFDAAGNEIANPDPEAGLYIRTRTGEPKKVAVPDGCLAFQIGETSQILTGGALRATPHYVKGPSKGFEDVSRGQLAVFLGPLWDRVMDPPEGCSAEDAVRGTRKGEVPEGVPPLDTRWRPGQDFGEFSKVTIEKYYE